MQPFRASTSPARYSEAYGDSLRYSFTRNGMTNFFTLEKTYPEIIGNSKQIKNIFKNVLNNVKSLSRSNSEYINKIFNFQKPHGVYEFTIGYNDKMNLTVIKENTNAFRDFLNSINQIGFHTASFHDSLGSGTLVLATRISKEKWVTTEVCGPSVNDRTTVCSMIHSLRIMASFLAHNYVEPSIIGGFTLVDQMKFFKYPFDITLQMENGEGPSTQNPEDILSGDEVSQKSQNTEITKEVDDSTNVTTEDNDMLQSIATTADLVSLPHLSERFIRLTRNEPLYLSTSDTPNMINWQISIPDDIYGLLDTTISTAVRNFTLIKCDVVLTFKVNANQAQCGRYIVSHFVCWEQLNNDQLDSVYRMLQRDHAIIDVSISNDVVYTVKFENIRPFLPVQTNELGETIGGAYARVFMRCLSPIRIADTGNPRCPVQIFARLENVKMTGMRFPVAATPNLRLTRRVHTLSEIRNRLQREGIESNPGPNNIIYVNSQLQMAINNSKLDSTLKNIVKGVGSIPVFGSIWKWCNSALGNGAVALAKVLSNDQTRIEEFESRLTYIGMINKDRPVDISHPSPLLPQPVHSYSYGRGVYSSKKLRIEPESTTPHTTSHKTVETTQSVLDLAQIPGLCARFEVSTTKTQGDLLIELPAVPFDPRYSPTQWPQMTIVPPPNAYCAPPISYISGLYEYYAGSIVYEFVPIKTSSHNFSIQVAFIPFNGAPGGVSQDQMQSCDWKTIDFRNSQSSSYTVPWVSTNPMRMWPYNDDATASTMVPYINAQTTFDVNTDGMKDPGKVVVRLVNEMNPTPIVTPTVEVLVFVKAHQNLRFLSPKTSKFTPRFPPMHAIMENDFTRTNNMLYQPQMMNVIGFPSQARLECSYNEAELQMGGITPVQKGDEQEPSNDNLRMTFGPQVQTMEKHDNMYDIMRRFQYHTTLTGSFPSINGTTPMQSFYPIATMPVNIYTRSSYVASPTSNDWNYDEYQRQLPQTTYRDAISMCHRWARGSMDYVFHFLTEQPVEISFRTPVQPPVGISGGVGSSRSATIIPGGNLPIYYFPNSMSFPTEVVEPRVNPIQTIEVPFYNINNFYDLQAPLFNVDSPLAKSMSDYPMQDLVSTYGGNLIFKQLGNSPSFSDSDVTNVNSTFKCRVLSALGDDMQYYHFLGTPPVVLGPSTKWTMTQFITSRNVRTKAEIQSDLIASGIESNPGPSLFSRFFQMGSPDVDNTNTASFFSRLSEISKIPQTVDKAGEMLNNFSSTALDMIKTAIATYTTTLDMLDITLLATSIMTCLTSNSNWFACITVFLQILKFTGFLTCASISNIFQTFLGKLTNGRPIDEDKDKELQFDFRAEQRNDLVNGLIAALVIESAKAYEPGTDIDQNFIISTVKKTFFNFNYARAGAICLFFTRFSNVIKTLWNKASRWFKGPTHFELLRNDPEFLANFMEDYNFVINELNLPGTSMIQSQRDRFWTTVVSAYYIKNMLAVVGNKSDGNMALLSAANEVIRKANDVSSHLAAPPVRYEPFVLWIYGDAGTGKSTLMTQLPIDMAKDIGHVWNGDPVYSRSNHSKFWNGYNGQPIVLIDDANAVDEPALLSQCISEFQSLKSCARMRIEMPRLEEKNAEVNSTIVAVCSNLFSWDSTMIRDKSAFHRRRDVVIKMQWTTEALDYFAKNPGQKSLQALNVDLSDPRSVDRWVNVSRHYDPASSIATKITYSEMIQMVRAEHKQYFQTEKKRMFERYKRSLELAKTVNVDIMDKRTLEEAVMNTILGSESSVAVSETLRQTYLHLKNTIPERFKELPIHTQEMLEKVSGAQLQGYYLSEPREKERILNHASGFVKDTLFPNFCATPVANRIRSLFYRRDPKHFLDSDLIKDKCKRCHQPHSVVKQIAYVCMKSTSEEQHWLCTDCAKNSIEFLCCDYDGLEVSHVQNMNYWFHKAAHLLKEYSMKFLHYVSSNQEAVRMYLQMASAIVSISMFTYDAHNRISNYYSEKEELEIATEYFENFGSLPASIQRIGGIMYVSNGFSTYMKDEDGKFVMALQPGLQMGKVKKNKKQEEEQQASTSSESSQEFHDVFTNEENGEFHIEVPWDSIQPKADPLQSDVNSNYYETIVKVDHLIFKPDGHFRLPCFDENMINITEIVDGEVKLHSLPFASCHHILDTKCPNCSLVNALRTVLEEKLAKLKGKKIEDESEFPKCLIKWYNNSRFQEQSKKQNKRFRQIFNYQKDLYQKMRSKFYKFIDTIKETICDKWKWIVSIFVIACCLYLGKRYIISSDGSVEIQDELQSDYNRPFPKNKGATTRTLTRTTRNLKISPNLDGLSVSKTAPMQVNNIANVIKKQVVRLSCESTTVSGFVLASQYALFPRHGIRILSDAQKDGHQVVVTTGQGQEPFFLKENISEFVFREDSTNETVQVYHKRFQGKDIRKHFLDPVSKDVIYPPFGYALDILTLEVQPLNIMEVVSPEFEDPVEIPVTVQIGQNTYSYTSEFYDHLVQQGMSGPGLCGSPLFSTTGKIIGMHVAGHTYPNKIGYATCLFKDNFDMIPSPPVMPIVPTIAELQMDVSENLTYVAPYPNSPYQPETTKMRESEIAQNAWKSTTYPCIQSRRDPRYQHSDTPLFDGASTIGAPTNEPEIVKLMEATNVVAEELLSKMPSLSTVPPLSICEAVTAQQHTNVETMNLSTSAGLPYISDKPSQKHKSHYIKVDVNQDASRSVKLINGFEKDYNSLYNMRIAGIAPRQPFYACLKDERRKPKKLESYGGTRIINVSPMELCVTCRRILVPFMDALHSDPVALHHGIGLAPDSPTWTDFIEYFRGKGECLIQLDFTKFSDSMPWLFVSAAFSIIKSYYAKYNALSQEVETVLNTIELEITQSLVCIGRDVYELKNGVLQGHPITSIINSLVNLIEQVYVWIDITERPGSEFFKNCGIAVMGDDVVIAVPYNLIRHGYHGKAIAASFLKMNILVTDENKDPNNIKKYQEFKDFNFIGRTFTLHPFREVYLAPADPESIFDTPLWINKRDDPAWTETITNCEQSLMLVYGHGPCIYEMYRASLEFLLEGRQTFRSWAEMDVCFMKETGMPQRSVDYARQGAVTETSSQMHEPLEAVVGRTGSSRTKVRNPNGSFHSVDFLRAVTLDTQGTEAGHYKCRCIFQCSHELEERVRQIEHHTGVSRTQFLPFMSQEEGTRTLQTRISFINWQGQGTTRSQLNHSLQHC